MRSIRQPVGIACILSAIALLVFTNPALAQANVTIIDSGESDELVAPPVPECNDLVFLTEVTFTPDGTPVGIPRFGNSPDLVASFDLPDFEPIGPSIIALDEVITFDGYANREATPAQLNERVRFEFLLNGEVQVSTPFTPDVPDGKVSAWLDVDMGTYELPNGADAMRIIHFGIGDSVDSVIVSAVCGTRVDFPTETTTTVADDTVTDDSECDDTVADDGVTDDGVADDGVCDDTVADDSECDDTAADDGVTDDGVCDDTVADDNECDDTAADDGVTDDAVCDDTVADDTVADDTVTDNSECDDTAADDTAADDGVADDGATDDGVADDGVCDDTVVDDTVVETTVPVSVAPTTVAPTTVAPTTVAPTTAAPTTAAPTTAAPVETTTTIAAEVEGTVETRSGDLLAVTGPVHDLGFVLIATGLVLLGSALLLQSKDPEELFS